MHSNATFEIDLSHHIVKLTVEAQLAEPRFGRFVEVWVDERHGQTHTHSRRSVFKQIIPVCRTGIFSARENP